MQRLFLYLILSVLALSNGVARAQIITDGSVGPVVSLTGQQVEIGGELGAVRGTNLFHSFEEFNIATGQTATFTGPQSIARVINRVTGGDVSNIDGTLRAEVGRDGFWFINPAGIMFGPEASIDVPASFHVSTADEVRFEDGSRFSAAAPNTSSLTVASPEAFGFLGASPGDIRIDGSLLEVAPEQTLAVVGGDIAIHNGNLMAPGGHVTLASSQSSGAIRITSDSHQLEGVERRGDIALTRDQPHPEYGDGSIVADVDASQFNLASAGGVVTVTSGTLTLQAGIVRSSPGEVHVAVTDHLQLVDGARISSNTESGVDAGSVTVVAGSLSIDGAGNQSVTGIASDAESDSSGDAGSVRVVVADHLQLVAGAEISSDTFSDGNAGSVTVDAGSLQIAGNALISSDTWSEGDAGSVTVNAGSLSIDGGGSTAFTGISSDANADAGGDAGVVRVVVPGQLQLVAGAEISSSTFAGGDAGSVMVDAGSLSIGSAGSEQFTGISSDADADASGDAGEVRVAVAGQLRLDPGGEISSDTLSDGEAGSVTVTAGSLLIDRADSALSTGISSDAATDAGGDAGAVQVMVAGQLLLVGGAVISSDTWSEGDAGSVTVTAGSLLIDNAASGSFTGISSDANFGSGGNAGEVRVSVSDQLRLVAGAEISSSTFSDGNAGSVTVDAGDLQLVGGALISSDTVSEGDAGSVTVDAGTILIGGASEITSSAFSTGRGGSVDVTGASQIALAGSDDDGPSRISARSEGTGGAGSVAVTAPTLTLADGAEITVEALAADGGGITIQVIELIDLHDSSVTTTVAGGRGNAGDISIDPRFLILQNSTIRANAVGGDGGNISIVAGNLISDRDSVIEASSKLGVSGTVSISSPAEDVSGGLVVLNPDFLDAAAELTDRCAAAAAGRGSSITTAGRGGLPWAPEAPLPGFVNDETGLGLPPETAFYPTDQALTPLQLGPGHLVIGCGT